MDPGPGRWQGDLIKHATPETQGYALQTHTRTESFCQIWINTNTPLVGWRRAAWGFRAQCWAYLAVSDLLSAPECGVTAGESRRRLETCLHLCIFHINKFLHRCIQTSLSALLHTTHSCHKHSDTQSTTREGEGREKGKGRRGRRRRRWGCEEDEEEARWEWRVAKAVFLLEAGHSEKRKTGGGNEEREVAAGTGERWGQESGV